ncbi:MAG TPA: RloB family protein, partial [Sedimentisphaerales bacterium]|nr:RloB family protein [Sedimentisphaerales bacterium]
LRGALRLHAVKVEVVGLRQSRPIDVVDHAISKKKQGAREGVPYDRIWCIVDVELPQHKTLDQARQRAAQVSNVKLILSNPFFEYWFLLHFKKIITPFSEDKQLQKTLKEVHPTYKKTDIGFNVLYPRTDIAIRHSKEVLIETTCAKDLRDYNPSTHVHILVEHLQKIALQ